MNDLMKEAAALSGTWYAIVALLFFLTFFVTVTYRTWRENPPAPELE